MPGTPSRDVFHSRNVARGFGRGSGCIATKQRNERTEATETLHNMHKQGLLHISQRGAKCARHKCETDLDGDDAGGRRTCTQCFVEGCTVLGTVWTEQWSGPTGKRSHRPPADVGRIGYAIESISMRQGSIKD